jgi:tRNA(Ile)-lysidine synthase TilS/MesJ
MGQRASTDRFVVPCFLFPAEKYAAANSSINRGLGLAVSGGSDSMALAYLTKKSIETGLLPLLDVHAFVVDHRARPDSRQEAETVAGWMEEFGMLIVASLDLSFVLAIELPIAHVCES